MRLWIALEKTATSCCHQHLTIPYCHREKCRGQAGLTGLTFSSFARAFCLYLAARLGREWNFFSLMNVPNFLKAAV